MNRYPLWKYAILLVALAVGLLYTLPNLFGESPAVQVSSLKATVKVDAALEERVATALKDAGINDTGRLREMTERLMRQKGVSFDEARAEMMAPIAARRCLRPLLIRFTPSTRARRSRSSGWKCSFRPMR